MYLLSQMIFYLFVAFALGVASGYALWRLWGEEENIEKYKAAEQRLAEYLTHWEHNAMRQNDNEPGY